MARDTETAFWQRIMTENQKRERPTPQNLKKLAKYAARIRSEEDLEAFRDQDRPYGALAGALDSVGGEVEVGKMDDPSIGWFSAKGSEDAVQIAGKQSTPGDLCSFDYDFVLQRDGRLYGTFLRKMPDIDTVIGDYDSAAEDHGNPRIMGLLLATGLAATATAVETELGRRQRLAAIPGRVAALGDAALLWAVEEARVL